MSERSKSLESIPKKPRHSSSSFNRPQSYGGQGGILFTKRKYDKKKRNSSSSTKLELDNNHNDDDRLNYTQKKSQTIKEEKEERNNGLLERRHVIGWDDVLCRPIYNTKKNTIVTTISPCSFNPNEEEDNESVNTSHSSPMTTNYSLECHASPEPFWSSQSNSKHSNKKRSYGRGKGHKYNTLSASSKAILEQETTTNKNTTIPILSKRNATSKLDTQKTSKQPKITIQCSETESKKQQQFDHRSLILTPDMYKTSVCSALDSDTKTTKATKSGKRTSRFSQRQNNHHPIPKMDCNFETTTSTTNNNSTKPFIKIPQPSHKTPLTVARAFFEDLDKNEVLTVSSNNDTTTSNIKRDPIRTKRSVNLADPKLQKQYSMYCNAARDNGVPPIDLKEFVKSRGNFFQTLGMFDGILEEI